MLNNRNNFSEGDHATKPVRIAFIGGGNMATALVGGLCETRQVCQPEDIHVVDLNAESLRSLAQRFGVKTGLQIDEAVGHADVILLCVKPQQMREVAQQLAPHLTSQLVLSIAAGIRYGDLSRWLNNYTCIVRSMPNMPALINNGITGLVAGPGVNAAQRALADAILSAVGTTLWLDDEAMLDPLTAVSGSGPAYVFYFIEAMQRAAEQMGFTPEQGRQLSLATFVGAAQLAAQSDEAAAVLRQRVTSKGVTTHAAITSMEASGVSEAIVKALEAAAQRGKELGDEFGK